MARAGDTLDLALFAEELAAKRAKAGLSQEQLAAKLHFSLSLVTSVECMRKAPSLEFAERCDKVFDTGGTFVRLQKHSRTLALPEWFRGYAEIEATAVQLRSWQTSFIDGLLQTEDYARVVLSGRPNTTEAEVDELVAARMERQAILERDRPPLLWAIVDEGALHREIAEGKVMHDQLLHLAQMSERPNINVEVVPYSAGPHYALLGAFNIAESADATRLAYLETVTTAFILESPAAVAEVALIFDTVRAETLSRTASRDLIRERAAELLT
jgi:transcriptional regulator with XRE-family HTH domain